MVDQNSLDQSEQSRGHPVIQITEGDLIAESNPAHQLVNRGTRIAVVSAVNVGGAWHKNKLLKHLGGETYIVNIRLPRRGEHAGDSSRTTFRIGCFGNMHGAQETKGGFAGPQNASRREAARSGEYWSPGLLRPDAGPFGPRRF